MLDISLFAILAASIAALNVLTFAAFGVDKRRSTMRTRQRAKRPPRRIPERRLLQLALLGGTPAAYAARAMFRHKTRKQPFSRWLHTIAAVQVLAAMGLGYAGLR